MLASADEVVGVIRFAAMVTVFCWPNLGSLNLILKGLNAWLLFHAVVLHVGPSSKALPCAAMGGKATAGRWGLMQEPW